MKARLRHSSCLYNYYKSSPWSARHGKVKVFTKDSLGGSDRPSYQFSGEGSARWRVILRQFFDLLDLKIVDVPVAAC